MKVLVILPQIPYPPTDGGKQGLYYRINALAKYHDISAVMFNVEALDVNTSNIKKYFPDLKNIKIIQRSSGRISAGNVFTRLIEILKWLLGNRPREARIYQSVLLNKYIEKEKFDLVDLEFPYVSELVDVQELQKNGIKCVCTIHNIEHKFKYDVYKRKGVPSFICRLEAERLKRYELELFRQMDVVFSISTYDAEYFNKLLNYSKVTYLPSILPRREKTWRGHGKYILFPGSLTFEPNFEGMKWFCENIAAYMKSKYGFVKIKITGKVTDTVKKCFEKFDAVEFTGFLSEDDLDKIYNDCLFAVVPIMSGAGIKIKILDCLSRGVPVVCSEFAALGIDEAANNMVVCKDTNEFAAKVLEMLGDSELRKLYSDKGYEYYCRTYAHNNAVKLWSDEFTQCAT